MAILVDQIGPDKGLTSNRDTSSRVPDPWPESDRAEFGIPGRWNYSTSDEDRSRNNMK